MRSPHTPAAGPQFKTASGLVTGGFVAALVLGAAMQFAMPADAQDTGPSDPIDGPPGLEGLAPGEGDEVDETPKAAILRGLDKVTARVREYTQPVGVPLRIGSLEVIVQDCKSRPPEEPPETTAFLEIFEHQSNQQRVPIFSGWMFASSPALNPLEHPVYDVWVMNCKAIAPVQGEGSL